MASWLWLGVGFSTRLSRVLPVPDWRVYSGHGWMVVALVSGRLQHAAPFQMLAAFRFPALTVRRVAPARVCWPRGLWAAWRGVLGRGGLLGVVWGSGSHVAGVIPTSSCSSPAHPVSRNCQQRFPGGAGTSRAPLCFFFLLTLTMIFTLPNEQF